MGEGLYILSWETSFYFGQLLRFGNNQPKKNSFKSGQNFMEDAQYSETNEESIFRIFRFIVCEIWSILYLNYLKIVNKNDHNTKNINRIFRKIDSFQHTAHFS